MNHHWIDRITGDQPPPQNAPSPTEGEVQGYAHRPWRVWNRPAPMLSLERHHKKAFAVPYLDVEGISGDASEICIQCGHLQIRISGQHLQELYALLVHHKVYRIIEQHTALSTIEADAAYIHSITVAEEKNSKWWG